MARGGGLNLVDALGRLLSDGRERARFRAAREDWIEALGLAERADAQALRDLDLDELEVQAALLLDKRASEVAEHLPRTRANLGRAYAEVFAAFVAQAPWPRGHLRHLHDARAFLTWLRATHPRAPHSRDEWSLLAELARREGRGPLQCGVAHHADLSASALSLAFRLGPWGGRLLLPLPLPSAWGRRWAWGAASVPGRSELPQEPMRGGVAADHQPAGEQNSDHSLPAGLDGQIGGGDQRDPGEEA